MEGSSSELYAPPPIVQEEDSDDFVGEEPKSGDEEWEWGEGVDGGHRLKIP